VKNLLKKLLKYKAGFLFLLPLTIGLLIFRVYGFFENFVMSFTKSGALGASEFIGLENYHNLVVDQQFWLSLFNTFKFVIICIPVTLVVAIFSAVLLNSKSKFISGFRTIYFLPAVILPVAVIQVIMWLFNTDYGLVNSILVGLGFEKVSWLSSNAGLTAIFSFIIIYLNFSVPTFIILAGLKEIPKSYYEAASVDRASKIRQFFHITLPMLTPSIFFVIITQSIGLLKLFDVPYIMTPPEQGGIGVNYVKTIVYYYYQNAFQYSNARGYASAISIVLFLIILILTLVMFRLQKKWVNYEK
jgi:multiple sugar transport system permease protein